MQNRHLSAAWLGLALVEAGCSDPATGSLPDAAVDAGASDARLAEDGGTWDAPRPDGPVGPGGPDAAPVVDAAAVADAAPVDAVASLACPAGWQEAFRDDFDSLDTSTRWRYYTGGENHSQAYYLSDSRSVRVAGGQLEIVTRRHCTDGNPQADTDSHPAPCPSGTPTKYSSGYLQSRAYHGADRGRLIVQATLPPRLKGLWPAIWLRNPGSWCTAAYGELDVMEWWFDDQDANPIWHRFTVTTHASCAGDSTEHDNDGYDPPGNADLTAGPHVFEAEWSSADRTVRYFYRETAADAPVQVASHTPASVGVTGAVFDASIGHDGGWQVRLNTQVVEPGYAWASPADDTAAFPDSTFRIDSVLLCVP